MGKIVSSIWQTLDGVIDARSMDKWFTPFDSDSRGRYINETIHDCEAMLYGRHTYELLSGYWSQQKNNEFGIADKLNQTKKYLISSTVKEANWGETIIIEKNVRAQVEDIKNQTQGNILIQGSASIVNLLLQNNLIDELKILVHPFVSGAGKKLFEKEMNFSLELINQETLDNGVVLLQYKGLR